MVTKEEEGRRRAARLVPGRRSRRSVSRHPSRYRGGRSISNSSSRQDGARSTSHRRDDRRVGLRIISSTAEVRMTRRGMTRPSIRISRTPPPLLLPCDRRRRTRCSRRPTLSEGDPAGPTVRRSDRSPRMIPLYHFLTILLFRPRPPLSVRRGLEPTLHVCNCNRHFDARMLPLFGLAGRLPCLMTRSGRATLLAPFTTPLREKDLRW